MPFTKGNNKMRNLLLILLFLPMIGFGQSCQYGSTIDASEICDFYKGNNFSTYKNADIALNKILDVTGMSKRFVLMECNDIQNCLATSYKGIRYILYDRNFMDVIATRTNSWSNLSILAHEIGHHVNGHSLDLIVYASEAAEAPTLAESRQMELEADEYSGFVMYKLGASLYQAQEAVRLLCTNDDDSYSTHPKLDKRLAAIEKGYNKAKVQSSNNDYSTNSSSLTGEDYFYKAYNSSDNQYKIDNYTKCLRIDPDNATAYYNRGNAYCDLGNYNDGIADFSKAIRIDPNYTNAYYNRGNTYNKLGIYNEAIADFSRVVRIKPDAAYVYFSRGNVYMQVGNYNDAIADYSRVIRIEPDNAEAYHNRGLAYYDLGNYNDAIANYSKAIRINPDAATAYYFRGYTKKIIGLPYCSDYKRACDLGIEKCCEWYYKQCR